MGVGVRGTPALQRPRGQYARREQAGPAVGAARNSVAAVVGQVWDAGPKGTDYWVCASNELGIEAGLYEIAFLVDGDLFFVESILVTPEPVPVHTVTFSNETGGQVCYLMINPDGSADTGLDELGGDEILAPGDQRSFQLPEGAFDIWAYDCENNALAELDAFVVTGPTTVSLTP